MEKAGHSNLRRPLPAGRALLSALPSSSRPMASGELMLLPKPSQQFRIQPVFIFSRKTTLVLVAQLYPTLCNPVDCSLPGSSVHGILQTRLGSHLPLQGERQP